MRDLVVGLDLGTSTYKAAAFTGDGQLVAETLATPTHRHPNPGWLDQDPANLLDTAALTLRQLIEGGIDPTEIRAIGLTGQLGGMVLVDDAGQAIGAHEVWLDTRCQAFREQLLREHGPIILAQTGIHPFQSARLRWRAEVCPDDLSRGAKAVQCWPYVGMTLAGLDATGAYNDWTSIGLFGVADVRSRTWSRELCDVAGIDFDLLPRIVAPWDVIGELHPVWSEATGLLAGTPIVAGLGDGIAGWLGCGAVQPGIAVDTVGSSDHFAVATDRFAPDPAGQVLTTFRSPIPDLWHVFGFTAGSGLSHQWFVRSFGQGFEANSAVRDNTWDTLEAEATMVPPGSERLVCIPHLEGRFCPDEPDVRGAWIGFTWQHGRAHFYRSILESIAYEYEHYVASMRRLGIETEVREVRVVGGGARSALWNQIKADVLGIPYAQLAPSNYTCRGAALCAGHAVGLDADLTTAASHGIGVTRRFEPDEERHGQYRPYVEHYRALMEELRPSFARATALP